MTREEAQGNQALQKPTENMDEQVVIKKMT